jgi:hypothetical protein
MLDYNMALKHILNSYIFNLYAYILPSVVQRTHLEIVYSGTDYTYKKTVMKSTQLKIHMDNTQ